MNYDFCQTLVIPCHYLHLGNDTAGEIATIFHHLRLGANRCGGNNRYGVFLLFGSPDDT